MKKRYKERTVNSVKGYLQAVRAGEVDPTRVLFNGETWRLSPGVRERLATRRYNADARSVILRSHGCCWHYGAHSRI